MPNRTQWQNTWIGLGATAADERLYRELVARYEEPHRKYHTLHHLDECFAKLDEIRALAQFPAEIELALWFHDAIYDVSRKDNEQKSAEWAHESTLAAGLSVAVAERVHALILITRHNAQPGNRDGQILVDVDLSILGASAGRFDEYENQIRAEFAWVPAILFRRKRREILREFLARPVIFNTAAFRESYEQQARDNLQRSLGNLS